MKCIEKGEIAASLDVIPLVSVHQRTEERINPVYSTVIRVAIAAGIVISCISLFCLLGWLIESFAGSDSKFGVVSPLNDTCNHRVDGINWDEYEDVSAQVQGFPDELYLYEDARYNAALEAEKCHPKTNAWKFDCFPNAPVDQNLCEKRGCCWTDTVDSNGVPYCYYSSTHEDYAYVNVTTTSQGYTAFLERRAQSGYPGDVRVLRLDVVFQSNYSLKIKIDDPASQRWEVPLTPGQRKQGTRSYSPDDLAYEVKFYSPVGFQVVRKQDGTALFDTRIGSLIFSDQFIQITSLLPSNFLYGLGENQESFLHSFDWQRVTLFNADQVPLDGVNAYGSHPFYLLMEESSLSHGVYLHNSNAMDVTLQPTPAITYRTIGGILEFYFFLGPSPADVIQQYTELIGRPFLPPYWSLGFHLCRFQYGSLEKTKEVMQRNIDAGIPLDVQWNDIDYMDKRKDFSYGDNFAGLPEFIEELHRTGRHYIPIIDPGISSSYPSGQYPPYDEGAEMDVFIKDSSGKNLIGRVWPGETVWPDFSHPNATAYWTNQLQKFHDTVPFDGLWIDMNDPSNFVDGSLDGCPDSPLEHPQFVPHVSGGSLSHKTICMTAKQYASLHYNLHNLYGNQETEASNVALATVRGARPFIISRSTFPGQGRFGGHWTGDIESTWHAMGLSIPGILNFNLFGIPMVGADICGFNGNTTAKLCQRWMSLGAFYPFSRNHNTDDGIDQDPVALGPGVVNASIHALTLRYKFLPYLYSLFYKAHLLGETVARPLFFEFPKDKLTYPIDDQFMWGDALMILPVLDEDVVDIKPYFPAGDWYLLSPYIKRIVSPGATFNISVPLDSIGVALKGGGIVVCQTPNGTTTFSRQNNFHMYVALDGDNHTASGDLFWDDGDSLDSVDGHYTQISLSAKSNSVDSTWVKAGYRDESMDLIMATIFGVYKKPQRVLVQGSEVNFVYGEESQMLIIAGFRTALPSLSIMWY